MDKINQYTSTGIKLLHHYDVIKRLKEGYGTPVSLQISPTSKCNLNCTFCSNTNRNKHESLKLPDIIDVISELQKKGLKAIEISGGGDPTLYGFINELIELCWLANFKIGMITNGLSLKEKVIQENLDRLTWLRISMNCLDYIEDIEIPKIKGTLGFSYVWNEKTTLSTIERLKLYVFRHNPEYVRIVPNCQATDEEQEENNRVLGETVPKLGNPFFYQAKTFKKPNKCYWNYLKPFILHDSWCYACSSVVLNYDAERRFHEKYRWVKMEDLPKVYEKKMESFPTLNCNHCVFSAQNEIIEDILKPSGMEDFL